MELIRLLRALGRLHDAHLGVLRDGHVLRLPPRPPPPPHGTQRSSLEAHAAVVVHGQGDDRHGEDRLLRRAPAGHLHARDRRPGGADLASGEPAGVGEGDLRRVRPLPQGVRVHRQRDADFYAADHHGRQLGDGLHAHHRGGARHGHLLHPRLRAHRLDGHEHHLVHGRRGVAEGRRRGQAPSHQREGEGLQGARLQGQGHVRGDRRGQIRAVEQAGAHQGLRDESRVRADDEAHGIERRGAQRGLQHARHGVHRKRGVRGAREAALQDEDPRLANHLVARQALRDGGERHDEGLRRGGVLPGPGGLAPPEARGAAARRRRGAGAASGAGRGAVGAGRRPRHTAQPSGGDGRVLAEDGRRVDASQLRARGATRTQSRRWLVGRRGRRPRGRPLLGVGPRARQPPCWRLWRRRSQKRSPTCSRRRGWRQILRAGDGIPQLLGRAAADPQFVRPPAGRIRSIPGLRDQRRPFAF
mmetsp:Transcript_10350/g.29496  ORF Transcript_10350/g.29496 Transcript_10350/m.29496 type:complete len:472 (+) Transcript_10350:370-1785(+)